MDNFKVKPTPDAIKAMKMNEKATKALFGVKEKPEPTNVNVYEKLTEQELVEMLDYIKQCLADTPTRNVKVDGRIVKIKSCKLDGIDYVPIWQTRISQIEDEIRRRNPEIFSENPNKTTEDVSE